MESSLNTGSILTKIIVGGISILIADLLLSGVQVDTWITGLILAGAIILINFTIKPILIILTLPLTLITFGLFLLVINALVVLIAAYFIPGFTVDGFWWALGFALLVSIVNGVFGINLNPK
ncbi:putative membrane protein [Algoriphagus boseongensis]|uniref:Putative membrane protein n=1 Tax=Algoriphagus boseongensis TaxID=1442587 RepID=A0A4R6TAY7_9BACT|nr:phage holin family protein [Algoriphagus boseongensis]TDQ18815.1 putative membrane protein [Algoriphagus boseongensis]